MIGLATAACLLLLSIYKAAAQPLGVTVASCNASDISQLGWNYDPVAQIVSQRNQCLSWAGGQLALESCNSSSSSQQWLRQHEEFRTSDRRHCLSATPSSALLGLTDCDDSAARCGTPCRVGSQNLLLRTDCTAAAADAGRCWLLRSDCAAAGADRCLPLRTPMPAECMLHSEYAVLALTSAVAGQSAVHDGDCSTTAVLHMGAWSPHCW